MAIYRVQDPSGQFHDIEGPEGASPEEVMQQAQALIPSNEKTVGGLLENAGTNAVRALNPLNMAKGVGETVKEGAYDLPRDITQGIAQGVAKVVTGKDQGDNPIEQRLENIANSEQVQDPAKYAYENPIDAAATAAVPVMGFAPELGQGVADTMAKYAGKFGEGQMGKLHGSSPAQFRQLGGENFENAMRTSYEMGDANLTTGPIARRQAIQERVAQIGNDIGDLRQQAAEAGPSMSAQQMADAIKAKLGPDYAPGGVKFDQAGQLESELENVGKMQNPDITDFAQRATDMNKEAVKNKLTQPPGIKTDVANAMASINDEEIAKRLPPELNEDYKTLKENFADTKPLLPMELRGEGKELLGKGSNTMFGMVKDALHQVVGGPKMGAQVGYGLEKALPNAPAAGKAVTSAVLMNAVTSNPSSLGKFAKPLLQAAQSGGEQAVAAMHFVLSHQYPEYNDMMLGNQ